MSYNLLLDTNFKKIEQNWKLTNCHYKDGYLVAHDTIYSIEQEIALTDATKLYLSMDYIAFNKDIKKIYIGIQCGDVLESTVKKPKFNKRCRLSVVHNTDVESIKVKFIVEAVTPNTKLYIDSPLLVDLNRLGKSFWPKWMLNKILDYRHGYNYSNLYKQCEITIDNSDFQSAFIDVEQANIGIVSKLDSGKDDWFSITFDKVPDRWYLVKLDLCQVNKYGDVYLKYGQIVSEQLDDEQLYIVFKADEQHQVRVKMKNKEVLPYIINFKRVLVVDITDQHLEATDIPHMPFIN